MIENVARVAGDVALTVGHKPARAMLLEEELDDEDDEDTLDPVGEPDVCVADDD